MQAQANRKVDNSRRRLRAAKNTPDNYNNLSKVVTPSKYEAKVLILDSTWQPHQWVPVEDAIVYEVKDLVQTRVGEDLFVFTGGVNRITGLKTEIRTSTILAIKGTNGAKNRRGPLLSNAVMFRRDRHVCAYCGDTHRESSLTRDHIQPVSKGGKNTWTNCVTACYPCNNRKGDRLLNECGMELLYVPYVPCHYENMLLQNRKILADQMDFLKNGIKNKESRALAGITEH